MEFSQFGTSEVHPVYSESADSAYCRNEKKVPPVRVGPMKFQGVSGKNQYWAFCGSNSVQPSVQSSSAEKAPM